MKFELCVVDWTAIAAIANTVMIIISFITLRRNKKQINDNQEQFKELKKQWEIDHKPNIDLKLIYTPFKSYLGSLSLLVYNYGKSSAVNIQFLFDNQFISGIPIASFKQHLIDIQSQNYKVLPEETIKISFCDCEKTNNEKNRSGRLLYGQELSYDEWNQLNGYLRDYFYVTIKYYSGYNSNRKDTYQVINKEPFEVLFKLSLKEVSHYNVTTQEGIASVHDELVSLNVLLSNKLGNG